MEAKDKSFGTHISSDMGLGVLGALLSLKGKKRKF